MGSGLSLKLYCLRLALLARRPIVAILSSCSDGCCYRHMEVARLQHTVSALRQFRARGGAHTRFWRQLVRVRHPSQAVHLRVVIPG